MPHPLAHSAHSAHSAHLPPSIRIAYPEDAARLSELCGTCICVLLRAGCGPCKAFWPTWCEFCESLRSDVVPLHCECSTISDRAATVLDDSDNASEHTTFPAVLVCQQGRVTTLGVDSTSALKQVRAAARAVLGQNGQQLGDDEEDEEDDGADTEEEDPEGEGPEENADDMSGAGYDEPTPLETLPMEELGGMGDMTDDDEDDRHDDDRVAATHHVPPSEAIALAKAATESNRVAILYYAPWCGHCTHFKPTWAQVVAQGKPHTWLAIDCDTSEGNEVAQAQGIEGFPTIMVHHKFVEPYRGERTADALVAFVGRKNPRPALLR